MSDQDNPRRAGDARRFAGVTDLISEATRIRSLGIHGIESVDPQIERRTRASAWAPTTDILAIGDDLVIRIELPGVDPATIDLRLTRGILTVSGSREDAQAPDAAAFLVRERYLGEFRRSLTLPEGTTPSQISAEFANGPRRADRARGRLRRNGIAHPPRRAHGQHLHHPSGHRRRCRRMTPRLRRGSAAPPAAP